MRRTETVRVVSQETMRAPLDEWAKGILDSPDGWRRGVRSRSVDEVGRFVLSKTGFAGVAAASGQG